MEEQHYKYPKTFHLPFSQGLQNDDRRMEDETCFDGKDIAITIKMDGENTSMYREGIHARSLYAMTHPSQHWTKRYHSEISYLIPDGWRICGESLYARHSISYDNLDSFFQVFSIWNEKNECLSFADTINFCLDNGIAHVAVHSLMDKFDSTNKAHWRWIEGIYLQVVEEGEEGIVIRNMDSYKFEDFCSNIAKAVRKNHVQTDEHWTKTWIPNKLNEKETVS